MMALPVRRFDLSSRARVVSDVEITPARCAVIAVDITGTVDSSILGRIATVLETARSEGFVVVYANNSAPRISLDRYEFAKQRDRNASHYFPTIAAWPDLDPREYHVGNGEWSQFDPVLAPRAGDYFVPKVAYSGFFGTALDDLLRSRVVDTVVCLGFSTSECVLSTVMDAVFLGYRTVVLRDCTFASDADLDGDTPGSWTERVLLLIESRLCPTSTSVEFAAVQRPT